MVMGRISLKAWMIRVKPSEASPQLSTGNIDGYYSNVTHQMLEAHWSLLDMFLENNFSSKLHTVGNFTDISLPYLLLLNQVQSSPQISLENRWVEGNVWVPWVPWSIQIGNLSSFQAPQRRFLWNHKLVFLLKKWQRQLVKCQGDLEYWSHFEY